MAITTGILRGGANSHQTTAEEANALATDFVAEGIVGSVGNSSGVAPATGGFAVNASSGMILAISSGVAYVTGTPTSQNSQTFRVSNSATANTTISANSSGSTKYDWVYIKLDPTNMADPNSAADNVATIVVSRSSSPSTDDGTPPTYSYPLAVVTVANGAVAIANGSIRDIRSQVALNTGTSNAVDGWTAASEAWAVSTGYNKGNKEYEITISGDKTSKYSAGMRIKLARGTTPPTQCADLESSSSQYASRASASVSGVTFTDDFTCEAWVKLESYANMVIISRLNTAGTQGWLFGVSSNGQLKIEGYTTAGGTVRAYNSYQSIPLNQWVHVAATLDMSGAAATTYINGISVPNTLVSGTATALIQAGDLAIGNFTSSTQYFDGKIADPRVWNAIRTATQIRDNMNQLLVGNESGLVFNPDLNGTLNDKTSNANNLTGSGGAVATSSDNPMNAIEYAIISKVSYSAPNTTVTVLTGPDYNIPNLTLSTPYYSTNKSPYGFPSSLQGSIQLANILVMTDQSTGGAADISGFSATLNIPTGAVIRLSAYMTFSNSTASNYAESYVYMDSVKQAQSNGGIASANFITTVQPSAVIRPTAGSHTFKAGVAFFAGSGTLKASTTNPASLIVEWSI